MKKTKPRSAGNGMRSEYDFRGGVRAEYARRYARGTNVVLLDPDVVKLFTDAASVNRALRTLAEIAVKHQKRKAQ